MPPSFPSPRAANSLPKCFGLRKFDPAMRRVLGIDINNPGLDADENFIAQTLNSKPSTVEATIHYLL
jgi:hypothetical protein